MSKPDYFAVFDLPRKFEVDLEALEKKYFELQQQFHPDRFVGKPEEERQSAQKKSAEANEGYKILKSRMKRAEHLVGDNLEAPPELLMEMMELHEEGNVQEVESELEKLFGEFAKTEESHIFVRIKYLNRFLEENAITNS